MTKLSNPAAASGSSNPVSIGPNYGDGTHSVTVTIGAVSMSATSTDRLATKDTWIPNVVGCADNANKNTTDLEVDGAVASRKDAYIGFDLSSLPSGATVTAATLTLYFKTAATTAPALTLNRINDGDEGWSESSLTCSGALTLTSVQTNTFNNTGAGADKSVSLNATWLTRLQSRMGVGVCTFVLTGGTTQVGSMVYQSKDSGGSPGNASGPRLTVTFTKTL